MIQPNMIASDSMTVSQSVFSTLGNTIPALSELSMFNDGGQVHDYDMTSYLSNYILSVLFV